MNELVKTGEYTAVNPNFISAQGIKQAEQYATGTINEINAGDIQNFTPLKQPEITPSTTSQAILGSIDAKFNQAKSDYDQMVANQLETAKQKTSESQNSLMGYIRQKINNIGSRTEEEQKANVPELNKLSLDAFNELQKSKQAQMNEIDAVNKSNMTDVGRRSALREITNRYAIQNANLATSYDIANRNYLGAKQSVEDKIKALNEPLDEYINYYTKLLDINSDALTRSEANALEAKRSEYETQRTQQTNEQNAIFEIQKQASENGADFATIQAIGNAKNRNEALQRAGQYGTKKQTQIIEVNGRKKLINSQTGSTIADLGSTKAPIDIFLDISPEQAKDPFIQKLLSSAGGKAMADTSIQKLDKALVVLNQLGTLQNNIMDAKTGPIVGTFKSKNPWDTKAQVIKSQLNAIVPNLARGVYGEVGVLTDNDIKTYSKTLGNLQSTNDVNNAIMYITLDMIGKSIKTTLSTNASAGRDVSGFVNIYTEMEETKNSILQSLPQSQSTEQTIIPLKAGSTGSLGSGISYEILPDNE